MSHANPFMITAVGENRHWKHIFQYVHAKALLQNAQTYYNAVVAKVSKQDRQSEAYKEWKINFEKGITELKALVRTAGYWKQKSQPGKQV